MRSNVQLKPGLVELIQWPEDSPGVLVWRFPTMGSEIKYGAKLTVRDFQQALFSTDNHAHDLFKPGLYTLTKENLPKLTIANHRSDEFKHPFNAEVYFVKTKFFLDQPWNLDSYITVRDETYGLIRITASGTFDVKITDAEKIVRKVIDTDIIFTTAQCAEMVNKMLDHLLPDALKQTQFSTDNSKDQYFEVAAFITQSINTELSDFGLMIRNLSLKIRHLKPEN
jgi:membrane protease subunit (stomatin/prohibitin family)